MKGCYLIHFDRPYFHAKHYIGWSGDIEARFEEHKKGNSGVALIRAVVKAGIELRLARVWEDASRDDERRMKNWKNAGSRLCPICKGER